MGAATGAAGAKAQREQQKRNHIPTEFLSLMISKVSYRGRQKSDKGSNSREGETPAATPAATGAADRQIERQDEIERCERERERERAHSP